MRHVSKESPLRHDWRPTNVECHKMTCIKCGKQISYYNPKDWDNSLEENCPQKKDDLLPIFSDSRYRT